MDYRVSVLQYEPKLLDKQKNLAMLREMLCELDTDLVVLPELCTTGYLFPAGKHWSKSVKNSLPAKQSRLSAK